MSLIDDMTEEMLARAVEIADGVMFATLEGLCVSHGEHGTVLRFTNLEFDEVRSLADAAPVIREAVEWLVPRGYIELAKDSSGEYAYVLRLPEYEL